MAEIMKLYDKVISIVMDAYVCMNDPAACPIEEIASREQEVDDLVEKLENDHIKRMEQQLCSANVGMLFVEMLTDLERISDHALNIAEAGQE